MSKERADFHVHIGDQTEEQIIDEATENGVRVIGAMDRSIVKTDKMRRLIVAGASRGVVVVPGIEVVTQMENQNQETVNFELIGLDFNLDHPTIFQKFDPKGCPEYASQFHARLAGYTRFLESQGFCMQPAEETEAMWRIIYDQMDFDIGYRLGQIAVSNPQNQGLLSSPRFQEQLATHATKRPQDGNNPAKVLYWQNFSTGAPGFIHWKFSKTPQEIIKFIHEADGVVILAHPTFQHLQDDGDATTLIDPLFDMGVDGVEGWHAGRLEIDIAKQALSRGRLVLGGTNRDKGAYSNRVMGKGNVVEEAMFISPKRLDDLRNYKKQPVENFEPITN